MDEYIKRSDVKDKATYMHGFGQGKYVSVANIDKTPAADVAPVVRGRWVVLDECSNEGAYCSVCNKKVYKVCYGNCKMRSKFCPNCGADMREG